MKASDYYLDIDKVSKLQSEDERNRIHNYYTDMIIYASEDGRLSMAISIKNTLIKAGYLIQVRDENIEKILS
jgi:predicted RNA-binding protein associated with RNAse of E/G family